MRNLFGAATAILLGSTALGYAGGIERSAFNPGILFETGNYVELSYGSVSPSVSGNFAGLVDSGNMAKGYNLIAGAMKMQLNDDFALGLIVDQPIGASVAYASGTGYPFAGSSAEVTATQVTALGLYRLSPNASVYGGLRAESASGEAVVTIGSPPFPTYELEKVTNTAYGYVVGAAYEKPEIALRVALSYISAIDHDFSGSDSYSGLAGPVNFTTTVPQALKLDFQTGFAADTLVFGSIQWREWSEFQIVSRDPNGIDARTELTSDNKDTVTYSLGLGRKFTETLSGAVSVGYEPATGGQAGNLSPTDGYTSLTLAGIYKAASGAKITLGATYGMLGDATTSSIGGNFTDNHFAGIGVKVGWSF